MIKKEDITGIVLAGGKSRRMSVDKGLVLLDGKPFVQHVAEVLKPFVGELLISSNNTEYDKFECKRIGDNIENVGPLGGLQSTLEVSSSDYNLVVSCGVPRISKVILGRLISETDPIYDVIQSSLDEKTMPLVAIYRKHCYGSIRNFLQIDGRSVREYLETQKVKTIRFDNRFAEALMNINTPEQLKQIKHAVAD